MVKLNCDKVNFSICLTDLKPERLQKDKNGKIYLVGQITPRKEADKYENDCNLSYQKTKEEREAHAPTIYINGNAKSFTFQDNSPAEMTSEQVTQADLPY